MVVVISEPPSDDSPQPRNDRRYSRRELRPARSFDPLTNPNRPEESFYSQPTQSRHSGRPMPMGMPNGVSNGQPSDTFPNGPADAPSGPPTNLPSGLPSTSHPSSRSRRLSPADHYRGGRPLELPQHSNSFTPHTRVRTTSQVQLTNQPPNSLPHHPAMFMSTPATASSMGLNQPELPSNDPRSVARFTTAPLPFQSVTSSSVSCSSSGSTLTPRNHLHHSPPYDPRPDNSSNVPRPGRSPSRQGKCARLPTKKGFDLLVKEVMLIKDLIVEGVEHMFGRWGLFVFTHPYYVMLGSLLTTLIFGMGLLPSILKWTDGAENLYTLPYSTAREDRNLHSSFFGDTATRRNVVVIKAKESEGTLMQWDILDQVAYLDNIVQGKEIDHKGRLIRVAKSSLSHTKITTGKKSDQSQLDKAMFLTFPDICARDPWQSCSVGSILQMGVREWMDLMGESAGEGEVDPMELYIFDGLLVNFQSRAAYVPEYYLGGTDRHPCSRDFQPAIASALVKPEHQLGPSPTRKGWITCKVECIRKVDSFLITYDELDVRTNDEINNKWEQVFINTFKDINDNPNLRNITVTLQAFRSRDDELKSSTGESNDIIFIVFTFVILISYSLIFNFSCDLYRTKTYSALGGFLAAVLGLVSGTGLVSLLGVSVVPTVLICPFLVVGIGLDDSFVVINSYCLSYMVPSAKDRCVCSMKESGLSITITTATNLIAFAVGAFSSYLSIKNFCLYSAAGLGMGYVNVVTFFFAVLCLEAQREEEARLCVPCFPSRKPKRVAGQEALPDKADVHPVSKGVKDELAEISSYSLMSYKVKVSADERSANVRSSMSVCSEISITAIHESTQQPSQPSVSWATILPFIKSTKTSSMKQSSSKHHMSTSKLSFYDPALARKTVYEEPRGTVGRKFRIFFLKYYGPFLMNTWVKVIVIVLFTALLIVSCFGFTKLEQGLDLAQLSPPDSYLRQFDRDIEKYYTEFDQPVDVFFAGQHPWWETTTQDAIRALNERLLSRRSCKMVLNGFLRMLDDPDIGSQLRTGNKKIFDDTMYKALSEPTSPFKQFEFDFKWQGRELYTYRFKVLPAYMRTSEQRAAWMQEIRADTLAFKTGPTPLKVRPYNYMMIFYESDLGLLSSVIVNMCVAAAAMLLVAFALIPQLMAGILVILIMVLIDLCLFGFMYFWSIKLNMVSMINLVISVGFAVDYSAHMCHSFTHCEGENRDFRVIESLVLMGTPVVHGAFSTLLGVFMLGFSTSYVFNIFFKMMVMVVVFGSLHGVVLLPVLLSLFGQLSEESHKTEGPAEEDETSPAEKQGDAFGSMHSTGASLPTLAPPTEYYTRPNYQEEANHRTTPWGTS